MFEDWNQIIAGCVVNGVATLNCLPAVFQNVINAAVAFAGLIALIFIILSGIKLITSGDDPKQVESARHTLTYAIAGLLLVLFSFFIINIIAYVTGAECIKIFGFNSCR